jgi:ribonuclease VapC
MNHRVVLDASAAMALLRDEPGAAAIVAQLEGAIMSAVNFAEVVTKLIDYGRRPEAAREEAQALPIEIVPMDVGQALDAGALRAATRHLGLSLGDRACLALGRRLGLPVLTCDRPWASLDLDMEIRLVR